MPARSKATLRHWQGVAGVLLLPCLAIAQPAPQTPWPGPQDMARTLQQRALPTPEQLATQPRRAVPNLAPAGTPAAAGSALDIATLARQGAALSTPPGPHTGASVLKVFITLEMPRASLQRLVDQAERTGATLVLRGLQSQSMRKTLAAVSALIGERRVSWILDPDAFLRFHVHAAPTFVLMLSTSARPAGAVADTSKNAGTQTPPPSCSATGCTAPAREAEYLSVSGDVSLDYALEAMVRRSIEATPIAGPLLQRLRTP